MIVYKNNYEEDEKLFSTGNDELDDILEEVYYSGLEDGYDYAQKEFAEKEEKKKKNSLKTAGKITLGAGGATALGAAIGENAVIENIAKKVAEKKGLDKYGWGLTSEFVGNGAKEGGDIVAKAVGGSKAMKKAKRVDDIGIGLTIAGASLLAANAIKNKKNKKKEDK